MCGLFLAHVLFCIFASILKQDSATYHPMNAKTRIPSKDSLSDNQFQAFASEVDTLVADSAIVDTVPQIIENKIIFDKAKDDATRHDGVLLPFSLERTDYVFGLLILCLIFFAHIGGLGFLKDNFGILTSLRKSEKIHKDTNIKETIFTYFLVLQTVVLISIVLYNELVELYPYLSKGTSPMKCILLFVVVIALFILVKLLFYRIVGYIFDIKEITKIWSKTFITISELLGILFFIPTVLLIYSNYLHLQIATLMLILLIFAQIILFYKIAVFFIREKFNFLFLIVYLCSSEIIPYLFLAGALIFIYSTDIFLVI